MAGKVETWDAKAPASKAGSQPYATLPHYQQLHCQSLCLVNYYLGNTSCLINLHSAWCSTHSGHWIHAAFLLIILMIFVFLGHMETPLKAVLAIVCLGDCLTHKKTESSSTAHGRQNSKAIQQSQSCSKRVKSEATQRMLAALCSKRRKRGQQNNFSEEAEVIHGGRYSSGLATPLNITGNSCHTVHVRKCETKDPI